MSLTFTPLADLARAQLPRLADKTAISSDGERLSYAQLEERSNRIANRLSALGVGAGERIAVLDHNRASFCEIWLGAAKIGAVIVPLNFRLAAAEVAAILEDAEVSVLFVGSAFAGVVEAIEPASRNRLSVFGIEKDYPAWRDAGSNAPVHYQAEPDEIVIQMYTSGTTGRPKGVMLSHARLMQNVISQVDEWGGYNDRDILLLSLPLFHIAGGGGILMALARGVETILMKEFDPAKVIACIQERGVTITVMVPPMLQAIVDQPNGVEVSSVRAIIYGAAPISVPLLQASLRMFPQAEFRQIYGLTETMGPFTILSPDDHHDLDSPLLKSCGRPRPGYEVAIVDNDDVSLPPHHVGEVICRGPSLMSGYWKRADATVEAMRGGWFHSGDLGYLDEAGYLYLYDRRNDMIVSGGENIYPAEIEAALCTHADVIDVAVIGVPDDRWGEVPKALVVLKPDVRFDADALLDHARKSLARFKVPKSVETRPNLPRNAAGKVLRRQLREPYWEGHDRRIG